MYSTYESFGQYCDGWVNGRILNITSKNGSQYSAFESGSLMPFFSSSYDMKNITSEIGTLKKFVLHIKIRNSNATNATNASSTILTDILYFFNIKSISSISAS